MVFVWCRREIEKYYSTDTKQTKNKNTQKTKNNNKISTLKRLKPMPILMRNHAGGSVVSPSPTPFPAPHLLEILVPANSRTCPDRDTSALNKSSDISHYTGKKTTPHTKKKKKTHTHKTTTTTKHTHNHTKNNNK